MWLKEFSSPGEDRNEFLKKFLGWIVQFIAYCFRVSEISRQYINMYSTIIIQLYNNTIIQL